MTGIPREIVQALAWLWLGMVLAISFLEAPLKFTAPGVDVRTGLSIGRVVFRALNAVEVVLAVGVVACLAASDPATLPILAAGVALVVLAVQLLAVRPALTRRSDAVLAGQTPENAPRSHAHLWYVGLEVVKVAGLVVLAVATIRP